MGDLIWRSFLATIPRRRDENNGEANWKSWSSHRDSRKVPGNASEQ